MNEWYRQIQRAVDTIDEAIRSGADEALTLKALSDEAGYSAYQVSRMFHALTGTSLRAYLRGRKLAFALVEVRDSSKTLLEIAVRYGFSSHEAFTRAFKRAYEVAPRAYRQNPRPVVLRTKINPLDRYFVENGAEITMEKFEADIKAYLVKVEAHRFLHIKNYESNGYFDFWDKQARIPNMDCDTICGLLDSIRAKLDGEDDVFQQYSGQIMGYPREAGGRKPEAYGVRLPAGYAGTIPEGMLMLDVPEGEYMVFEHGPFDFETQCDALYAQLDRKISEFDWERSGYVLDDAPGRIAYYYNDPSRFIKRVLPVKKK